MSGNLEGKSALKTLQTELSGRFGGGKVVIVLLSLSLPFQCKDHFSVVIFLISLINSSVLQPPPKSTQTRGERFSVKTN